MSDNNKTDRNDQLGKQVDGMSEKVKISTFMPDQRNANKGTERGSYMVRKSLEELGAGRSIVLDKHGNIIAGNKTAEAAEDLGIDDVIVVRTDGKTVVAVMREDLDLTDDTGKARQLAYADNRAGQVSLEFDPVVIEQDLELGVDLTNWFTSFELDAFGIEFGEDEDENAVPAEAQISRADELAEEWGVELGQVWRLPSRTEGQEHRLICGDCTTQKFDGLDVVLTDPPYGVNMDKGFAGEAAFSGKGKPIPRRQYTDDWDDSPPSDLSHLLIDGVSIVWGGNNFCDNLPVSSHWLVWDKHNTMPSFGDCELAWTNVKRKSVKKYDFEYNGLIGREKERFHPTQKPVGLFVKILEDYSKVGQVVADFYLGSGTTLIACENISRQCRAVEISPAYVAVALQRYKDTFGIEPELIGENENE